MGSRAGDILNSNYSEMRRALDQGELSSVDLTEESLRRIASTQGKLNAYISFMSDEALDAAKKADIRLKSGERNALLGIPVGVKDMILCRGQKTTAASKILSNFIAPYDATVTERLKLAGAPLVGKTNLDEFAMGSSNENSAFGAVKNPWDLTCVPGGSSGGSAAAVAARTVTMALGTDTGGSIRQPSSFCGISGLKPTYGLVSRFGVVAFASSLDQVGPMAVDAASCAALLQTIGGHDVHDGTSEKRALPNFLDELKAFSGANKVRGLRIGLPRQFFEVEGLDFETGKIIQDALGAIKEMGAHFVNIELPHMKYSLPVYYLICTSEASSNLARYDGIHYGHRSKTENAQSLEDVYACSRGEGFGSEVRLRILLGTFALSSGYYDAYFQKAAQVRALIQKDFTEAFKLCDVIAGPTSPTTAFKLGERVNSPLSMYLADVYTLGTNLAGLPGMSINVGFDSKKLPVGLQLMAPRWQDATLLGLAAKYQEAFPQSMALSPVAKEF